MANRATSLNGHDLNVVRGVLPVSEGDILLTDGAGRVEEVGSDVSEFAVKDRVISTFYPDWEDGWRLPRGFIERPVLAWIDMAQTSLCRPFNTSRGRRTLVVLSKLRLCPLPDSQHQLAGKHLSPRADSWRARMYS